MVLRLYFVPHSRSNPVRVHILINFNHHSKGKDETRYEVHSERLQPFLIAQLLSTREIQHKIA